MLSLLLPIIYLSFISLGLPDSLLGSAWPSMYEGFGVPISFSGIISMIISGGTIVSSLQSDRLTRALGAGKVTAISVAMTAVALMGFSISGSFIWLCLWAIPYGLGAGSVDAALNNYVALHYTSRHMSWLHCMWGVGATVGPYIMGFALTGGLGWPMGYRIIGILQIILTLVLVVSLPLWKMKDREARPIIEPAVSDSEIRGTMDIGADALSLRQIFNITGARYVMGAFFCYSVLESTPSLWASSYLTFQRGLSPETAASYAGLFFIGITVGRFISGFLTMRFNDTQMIRLGQVLIAIGLVMLLIPAGSEALALPGLIVIGLGCAPIYPCIIHSTPDHFGPERSQAVIGVQMASAYVGTSLMPPFFGLLANHIGFWLYPIYLLIALVVMVYMHERLVRVTR